MSEPTLYYKPTCPFCLKVLHFMKQNDITISTKNTSENSDYRKELLDIGGKSQVPCLVVDGKALYESDNIIDWLQSHYLK